MIKRRWALLLLISFFSIKGHTLTPDGDVYLRELQKKSVNEQVKELLTNLNELTWMKEDRPWLHFYVARLAKEQENPEVTASHLNAVAGMDHPLGAFALIQLFDHAIENNQMAEANKLLERVKDHPARSQVRRISFEYESRRLGHAIRRKNFQQANQALRYLHRNFKSELPLMVRAEQRFEVAKLSGSDKRLCHAAKDLFVKYPESSVAQDWVGVIPNLKMANKNISCPLEIDEKRQRVRRLLLLDLRERLEQDLAYYSQKKELTSEEVALIRADFLLRDGDTAKALKILEGLVKKDPVELPVLQLHAMALSRSQKFEEASLAYLKIYEAQSSATEKAQAYFDHAFVLYQGGRYAPAYEGFEKYLKKYRNRFQANEAVWYLGWLSFLKNDFAKAADHFENLISNRSYREKTKVLYWLARSYWELSYPMESMRIMSILKQEDGRVYNYYANLSRQWYSRNYPSLSSRLFIDGEWGLLSGFAAVQNFESFFNRPRPDLDSLLKHIDITSPIELGEFASNREPSSNNDESEPPLIVELNNLRESEYFAKQFADNFNLIQGLLLIGERDIAIQELRRLYSRVRSSDQRLLLLSAFERLGLYQYSARSAELSLLSNSKLDRTSWVVRAFPLAYQDLVHRYSERFGVEPSFILSIMRAESFFNPRVESPAHARGLMQLMPFTADRVAKSIGLKKQIDMDALFDPQVNIQLGTAYLSRLLRQFDQNIPLAAASYNAGPHRVQTWLSQFGQVDQDVFIEHIPFRETRGYVKKVMGFMDHYSRLLGQAQGNPTPLLGPIHVREVMRIPASKERWEDI